MITDSSSGVGVDLPYAWRNETKLSVGASTHSTQPGFQLSSAPAKNPRQRKQDHTSKMATATAGQGALRTLPSTRHSTGPIVASYDLPPKLKAERKSLKDATATGIEVLKVTKVLKKFFESYIQT